MMFIPDFHLLQSLEASADDGASTSSSDPPRPRPVLDMHAQNNPNLEELEITAVNFHSALHANRSVNSCRPQFSPW
jgi:hypothetical protein